MRGSGSQFGIVTKYTVKVHPIADVWGGLCIYDSAKDNDLYAALHNFVANGAQDPKAAIIFSNVIALGGIKTTLIYYFYDGPSPPTSGPFADFIKISGIFCSPKKQKYSELVSLHCTSSPHSLQTSNLPPPAQIKRRASAPPQRPSLLPRKSLIPLPTHTITPLTTI